MAISILLIYKIANFFGLRLKCLSLVLCGILAFLVNFVTIALSPFLTWEHYLRIFGFVLAAAALVTCYNSRLLKKDSLQVSVSKSSAKDVDVAGTMLAETETTGTSKPADAEDILEPAAAPTVKPAATVAAKPAAAPAPIHHAQAPAQHLPAVISKTIAEIVQEDMENDNLLKLTAAIAKLGSLDAILDYAFSQNERHNHSNAIFAYRRALERYHSDPYAPFITIELANIYKDLGAYDEAIHSYEDAFALPALTADHAMQAEFKKTIVYLDITKTVLIRHHALKTPFDDIPAAILQEVEMAFQKYCTKAHAC
jgi:colicin import membrane protein